MSLCCGEALILNRQIFTEALLKELLTWIAKIREVFLHFMSQTTAMLWIRDHS